MTFKEFLKKHPNISIAKKELHNNELLNLYSQTKMKGALYDLDYDRSPNFFKVLELHNSKYFTLIVHFNGKTVGSGTFIVRKGWEQGEIKNYLYASDLRIKGPRKVISIWRKFYSDFLKNLNSIDEFSQINASYAVTLLDNHMAKNTLRKFNHKLLSPFVMRNILFSFKKNINDNYKALKSTDFALLDHLMNEFYKNRKFGYFISSKNLHEKWITEPHYGIYIIKGLQNNIIGGGVLWSPRKSKKINVKTENLFIKILLKFLSFFSLTPANGGEIKSLYLSHIFYDQEKKDIVYETLIKKALKIKKVNNYHFVSIQDFDKNSNWSKKYISINKSIGVYTVNSKAPQGNGTSFEFSLA